MPAVSANILARRLRELEEAGIISRRALTAPAGCKVYELTSLVEAAHPVIGTIDRWASVLVRLG
ncbi:MULTISPECIES: winged helix-turn-helix transcriptional regulator [Novosphingobium]|uniref:winged helix-turn-helix transcriptional regulator n=1 Tax=Novosphingobium sp. TaxID=1874826 RepID=UPI0012C1942A|nr:transcriptional regulator [Novosphingobium sp.]